MGMNWKKYAINTLLVVYISCSLIDALPVVSSFHKTLKTRIDLFIDKSGIWQGPWNLFGPEVDKDNCYITAEIEFENKRIYRWRSPDWKKFNRSQKFIHFREMEYIDSIRNDSNRGGWESFSDYLARQHQGHYGNEIKVKKVSLTRHWQDIRINPQELSQSNQNKLSDRFLFYTKDYNE